MKTLLKLCLVAISSMLLLNSCKKDDNDLSDFEINNPVGYMILYNKGNTTWVYEFASTSKLNIYTTRLLDEYNYTVVDNKVKLAVANEYFLISRGKVTHYVNDVLQDATVRLVKKPDVSQLAGKTFTGTYKTASGSIVHPNFFYTFHPNANKVDAGYIVGTTVRTENYNPIGNIGSRTQHYGPEYYEMLILIDGKLYATYIDNTSSSYAVLSPQ